MKPKIATRAKISQARASRQAGKQAPAYHHGALRLALIGAARSLLEAEGFEALTLRAAARRAGVSQAAPYHHFADKQALLVAVATTGFQDFAAAMQARMAQVSAPAARLNEAGIAYVAFAVANPALFKLMFGGCGTELLRDPALAAARESAYAVLQSAVAATLTQKEDSGKAASRRSLGAWALVHGLATLINEGGVNPFDYGAKSAEALTAMLLEPQCSQTMSK